jgi:hypothetical protein
MWTFRSCQVSRGRACVCVLVYAHVYVRACVLMYVGCGGDSSPDARMFRLSALSRNAYLESHVCRKSCVFVFPVDATDNYLVAMTFVQSLIMFNNDCFCAVYVCASSSGLLLCQALCSTSHSLTLTLISSR